MRRLMWLCAILLAGALTMAARQAPPRALAHRFDPVADGVFAAIGTGGVNVGSNSLVIVNSEDVVVVDAHVTPAAARALLEDIRTITAKPVRYVIDSHYHWDHAHGNQVFSPDVQLIGHEFVREMLQGNVLAQRTYTSFTGPLPGQLATLQRQAEAETDAARKQQLAARVAGQQAYLDALAEIRPTPPNVTYRDRMTLVRGGREIQLLFLGRGHTAGDTVVYLPKEKVIATGDLVVGDFRFMYMGDAFVNEWPDTVEKLLQLDFTTVVPGHGTPFTDKAMLRRYQSVLARPVATGGGAARPRPFGRGGRTRGRPDLAQERFPFDPGSGRRQPRHAAHLRRDGRAADAAMRRSPPAAVVARLDLPATGHL